MFTGIISFPGRFKTYSLGKQVMSLEAPELQNGMEIGESLAVNGVCLSLIRAEKTALFFNLSDETIKKTTLGSLRFGQQLNLERPLTLSQPLSGHLVSGHIDGCGKITGIQNKKNGKRFTLSFPGELKPYMIPKGSIALDGVSLTIAELHPTLFEVEIIPITLESTNLNEWKKGQVVNIECDIIGKYMYNWIFTKER